MTGMQFRRKVDESKVRVEYEIDSCITCNPVYAVNLSNLIECWLTFINETSNLRQSIKKKVENTFN